MLSIFRVFPDDASFSCVCLWIFLEQMPNTLMFSWSPVLRGGQAWKEASGPHDTFFTFGAKEKEPDELVSIFVLSHACTIHDPSSQISPLTMHAGGALRATFISCLALLHAWHCKIHGRLQYMAGRLSSAQQIITCACLFCCLCLGKLKPFLLGARDSFITKYENPLDPCHYHNFIYFLSTFLFYSPPPPPPEYPHSNPVR